MCAHAFCFVFSTTFTEPRLVYWFWGRNCIYLELRKVHCRPVSTLPLSLQRKSYLLPANFPPNHRHPRGSPEILCKDVGNIDDDD